MFTAWGELYEMLTGHVPFPGKNIAVVIEKVVKGDFAAASTRPFHTRCAGSGMPEGDGPGPGRAGLTRCTTLQDLEHWLADEPVAAYSEPRLERFGAGSGSIEP